MWLVTWANEMRAKAAGTTSGGSFPNPCVMHLCPLPVSVKHESRDSSYQPGSLEEQTTGYVTWVARTEGKLWFIPLGCGGCLSLQHKLVPPDRYNGPVHVTNGNLQFLIQPHLAFRFPLCFIKLSGPKSALKPPNTKLSPGLWVKTDTCCYTAPSNPVKLQCRPIQIP